MNIYAKKKIPYLFYIVFFIFLFFVNYKDASVNFKEELVSTNNSSLPELPNEYLTQKTDTFITFSKTNYRVRFEENDFERFILFIGKNPNHQQLEYPFRVDCFPTNSLKYKNLKNFKDGKLDYTPKTDVILYTYKGNEYFVRKINLPFINFDSIYLFQFGCWKYTFHKTFPKVEKTIYKETINNIYDIIFAKLLKDYNILSKTDVDNSTNIEITNSQDFWRKVDYHNNAKNLSFKGKYKKEANALLATLNKEKRFNQIFDIDKLAIYYSLINLFSNNENKKIGLAYNVNSKLLEPMYMGNNKIGTANTYLKKESIKDLSFLNEYTQKLNIFKDININLVLNDVPKLKQLIASSNQKRPDKVFNINLFEYNKLVIRKGINPPVPIKIELLKINKNSITLTTKNFGIFPVELNNLEYNKKKNINSFNKRLLLSNKTDTITIELPRSFENLFVDKKKKSSGFQIASDLEKIWVSYHVYGLNTKYYTQIIPYQPMVKTNIKEDLFRLKHNESLFSFLQVNRTNKTITFSTNCTIDKPLLLPKGYTIIARPGIVITINNGGKIISQSPLQFIGTKNSPIKIVSKDQLGQGLLILANGEKSQLQYVHIDGLTNPSHGFWSTSGAITFYESPVKIEYCKIRNNTCEDALNIVRSNFELYNSSFDNTQSDAFDGDFINGYIDSCVFTNIGNDAIDVSGSNLKITNILISNAGDKGISAGENSKVEAKKVRVDDCEIAVAGKDLSTVNIEDISIKNTKLGFTAFQKKPEFGPSNITAKKIVYEKVKTKYLIERTSLMTVDNDTIKTTNNVKNRMYGVDFGVSSKETRKKKRDAKK